jgi:ribosome-associated toxin RatA of RatAB toxin-antitoxin module
LPREAAVADAGARPAFRFVIFLCLAGVVAAAPAAEISVKATSSGEALEVQATAELSASLARAWEVLTDYNRFTEFVPDLHVSRIVSRKGNTAVVDQKGLVRFLFFSYPVEVRLAVTEVPRRRIESLAVTGNFREMRCAYDLEVNDGRIVLRYSGRLIPDFNVPPIFRTYVLRRSVEDTFRALVEEIERGQKPVTGDQ